ncbi:cell wall elongation regulator TseB-like domain-containing protein [Ferviditalea candida]|uniref:DUF5590 domain-containing protein n=1 Tax=Ferviditalea candida TaxID=3108399 RepID=A0ABU5ZFM3_9BACL|nr:DUF5590 domain-containing protein [Paenibacillaceae bacterium T2]
MKKPLVILGLGFFVIAAIILVFYNLIQRDHWQQQNTAIKQAKAQTNLVSVTGLDYYAGEAEYTIIYGKDSRQRDMIVWAGNGQVHAEYTADGIVKSAVEANFHKEAPNARIIRIVPGVLNGNYIWEVFYQTAEDGKSKYYYKFYRFSDGEWIDTFYMGA